MLWKLGIDNVEEFGRKVDAPTRFTFRQVLKSRLAVPRFHSTETHARRMEAPTNTSPLFATNPLIQSPTQPRPPYYPTPSTSLTSVSTSQQQHRPTSITSSSSYQQLLLQQQHQQYQQQSEAVVEEEEEETASTVSTSTATIDKAYAEQYGKKLQLIEQVRHELKL